MNKKDYVMPQMEVINMGSNHLLAGSIEDGTYGGTSDAPAMMNMPEEDIPSEHEE